MLCEETVKLWKIAGPIAFNIICHHGRNLLTLYLSAILETFTSLPFPFPFLSLAPSLLVSCWEWGVHWRTFVVKFLVLVKSTCWYLLAKNMHGSSYGWSLAYSSCSFAYLLLQSKTSWPRRYHCWPRRRESTLLVIPHFFSLATNFPTQKFLQAQIKVNALAWIGFGG